MAMRDLHAFANKQRCSVLLRLTLANVLGLRILGRGFLLSASRGSPFRCRGSIRTLTGRRSLHFFAFFRSLLGLLILVFRHLILITLFIGFLHLLASLALLVTFLLRSFRSLGNLVRFRLLLNLVLGRLSLLLFLTTLASLCSVFLFGIFRFLGSSTCLLLFASLGLSLLFFLLTRLSLELFASGHLRM